MYLRKDALPRMVAGDGDASDYSQERCWWCGTAFSPRGRKVYCSDSCRRAAWWVLNPNALRESSARFRERHPERAREIARLAYERHREKRLALAARWAEANPQRKAAAEQRRRAAKRGTGGDGVEAVAWLALIAAAGGRCNYCGEIRRLTMDHRIPLSRGGRHEIANIIPACKPCNSRKNTRTEDEYRAFLLDERQRGISESEAPYGIPQGDRRDINVSDRDMPVSSDDHAA